MHLVIDIGGTFTRGYLIDPRSGEVLDHGKILTIYDSQKANLELSKLAKRLGKANCIDYVCVGFPAPVEGFSGILSTTYFDGPKLTASITSALKNSCPEATILFSNDVTLNAFHYVTGEHQDFAAFNLGTSIGMKVFTHGKPMTGINNRGGEIGHIRTQFANESTRCGCGEFGHLGPECSGKKLLQRALDRQLFTPHEDSNFFESFQNFCELFLNGNDIAKDIVREHYQPLASIIATVHLSIGVESFILFGGTALALGNELQVQISQLCDDVAWNNGFDWENGISLGVRSCISAPSGGQKIIEMVKLGA